jgi:hypothetical protein
MKDGKRFRRNDTVRAFLSVDPIRSVPLGCGLELLDVTRRPRTEREESILKGEKKKRKPPATDRIFSSFCSHHSWRANTQFWPFCTIAMMTIQIDGACRSDGWLVVWRLVWRKESPYLIGRKVEGATGRCCRRDRARSSSNPSRFSMKCVRQNESPLSRH